MDSYFIPSSSIHQTEEKSKPYRAALHEIRKHPQPRPMTKKPIAPLPPTPPRIYLVDATNFKQVVQMLTTVPQLQSGNLQDFAPPHLSLTPTEYADQTETLPLPLLPSNNTTPSSPTFHDLLNEKQYTNAVGLSDNVVKPSASGISLSPATLAWCSYLLETPGTVATLEQRKVL